MKSFIKLLSAGAFTLLFVTHAFAASLGANFIWGAAFSAHQTEGVKCGGKDCGGGQSDWFVFEHPQSGRSPISRGQNADVSDNFWDLYARDIKNAKDMGLNSLRTSVAWEKIEPQQGVFNQAVLDHYKEIFGAMKAAGIRPMIALHHSVNPLWFMAKGGWESVQSPYWFLEYAQRVIRELGPYCDLWIPFNEPMMFVQMSYLKTDTPPQRGDPDAAFEAAFNLLRAHRLVAHFVHGFQGFPNLGNKSTPLKGVTVAYAFGFFEPVDPKSPRDVEVVDQMMELSNWAWLRAVNSGDLRFNFPSGIGMKNYARQVPKDEQWNEPYMDFLGINYYSRWKLAYDFIQKVRWVAPPPIAENNWPIYPEGLGILIDQVKSRFSIPIVITENGIADSTDLKRQKSIVDHLASMDGAMARGADVRGYYHWSLMDNFEWLSGFDYKFGLFAVDVNDPNLTRVPRGSVGVYSREIRARR